MRTQKLLVSISVLLLSTSCSTDEMQTDLKSKSETTNSRMYGEDAYGMPFDDRYLYEDLLIKIVYNNVSEERKVGIRRKFLRNHPDLVLVKIVNRRSPVEYWFLKSMVGQNAGSTQYLPDEDPEEEPSSTRYELRYIIQKIRNHELMDVYEEGVTRN